MTLEQFQGGEVCYKLNGDQSVYHWYQTLGLDEFPVLDKTHETVGANADGTYDNADAIKAIDNGQRTVGNAVYDLSGRKVSNSQLKKGLYIVNGKKILY